MNNKNRWLLIIIAMLLLSSLACQAVARALEMPNPDGPSPTYNPTPAEVNAATSPAFEAQISPTAVGTDPPVEETPRAEATDEPTNPTEASSATARPTSTIGGGITAEQQADIDQQEPAMLGQFASDVDFFTQATHYAITMTLDLDEDSARIEGTQRVRYTNTQTSSLDSIVFMLWPNERSQFLGGMEVSEVRMDGEAVDTERELGDLAIRLPLGEPLEPGDSATVDLDFITTAEEWQSNQSYRFGVTNGAVVAPDFYPLVPRIVDGEWQLLRPSLGDPVNSDSALFEMTITWPTRFEVVVSGVEVGERQESSNQTTATFVTGPMRDVALAAGPLKHYNTDVDGVTVNAWMLSRHETRAEEVLESAAKQVELLSERVGEYPFKELDIVDAPGAFGGVEFPGLVLIGVVGEPGFGTIATVHEVGHQWFYSLIGDDQQLEPRLDEAAASYTEVLYVEETDGEQGRQQYVNGFLREVERISQSDMPIGLPADEYGSWNLYGSIVYAKGAVFFDVLRREVGDDAFFGGLQVFFGRYRYGFASSQGFQDAFEESCSCDLQELFDLWVYEGGPIAVPEPSSPTGG